MNLLYKENHLIEDYNELREFLMKNILVRSHLGMILWANLKYFDKGDCLMNHTLYLFFLCMHDILIDLIYCDVIILNVCKKKVKCFNSLKKKK
jgi:hypothetical protein